jgi:hypothetical protein
LLKPSVRFSVQHLDECVSFNFKSLNLTLKTTDYDQNSMSLFVIDHDNFLCTKNHAHCLCYFQIRLTDDPLVRDRINREAKEAYQFSLMLNNTQTKINVNIDDKNLEPMFDLSEYVFALNQFEYDSSLNLVNLPEFSVIGKVSAVDPDLYYSQMNPYFGVNSDTGYVYLKKSASFLFDLNETELALEVKTTRASTQLD